MMPTATTWNDIGLAVSVLYPPEKKKEGEARKKAGLQETSRPSPSCLTPHWIVRYLVEELSWPAVVG